MYITLKIWPLYVQLCEAVSATSSQNFNEAGPVRWAFFFLYIGLFCVPITMLYYNFPSLMIVVMMKLTRNGDLVMCSEERIFFLIETKASGNVFT